MTESTILCAAAVYLPGIRPCTHLGLHDEACESDTCTGCLPHAADGRGYLCHRHWEQLQAVHIKWGPFRRLVLETEGRAVSPDSGGIKGSSPSGFTNLPLTTLILDECDRLTVSLKGLTLDAWVHTEAGARDAVLFTAAADRAFRSLEVERRPVQLVRERCPECGLLTVTGNPARYNDGTTVVTCQHCGAELAKVRDDAGRPWSGSEACEADDHHGCRDLTCRCDCHLERKSSLYTVQVPAHLLRKEAS
jgi:ribosomal protein S27E